jgi:UDP-2,3-diacylglucosamine pyrophosphatase LpxH
LIIVVSDLHLDFSSEKEISLFFDLIKDYSGKANILVINGDIFDSPSSSEKISGIVEKLTQLVFLKARFKKIYYVVGNHDLGLNALRGKYRFFGLDIYYPSLEFEWHGRKLYFEHGHRYDPLFKYSLYDLMKIVEERGGFRFGDLVEDFLKNFYGYFQTEQQPGFGVPESLSNIWREAAKEIARNKKPHLVAFGHTHRGELLKVNNCIYLNTGSFYRQYSFAVLEKNQVKLMAFKNGDEEIIGMEEFS